MNIISNTLISLESDEDINLFSSTTSILDERKFRIQIGDIEHDLSIETIHELKSALDSLQDVTSYIKPC